MFTTHLVLMLSASLLAMVAGWAIDALADHAMIDPGRSTRLAPRSRPRPSLRFDAFDAGPVAWDRRRRLARRA